MSDNGNWSQWNARCHYCGRDSIVELNRVSGRFAEHACPHCGQVAGFDGLGPKGQSMSADMSTAKAAENKPKTKGDSPLKRLIGGK
jgi:hypothetical protein